MNDIKDLIKHIPLKKYGQNFLLNKDIIKNIITKINPNIEQNMVEIGPGLAALTEPISELLKELVVIEIDHNLLHFLKKQSFYSKLIVFCQDALTVNYTNLFHKKKLIRIFGNLPYNIGTALILFLFKHIAVIQDMNFMLQKEVAERLIASPGNKSYCRLSVISQYYCNIKVLLYARPEDFYPVPKVDSMFVNLIPYHNNSPYFVYDIRILSLITCKAFQNRRKILRHSLKDLFSEKTLLKLDINSRLRAENLSVLQYCQLANYLYKKIKTSTKTLKFS